MPFLFRSQDKHPHAPFAKKMMTTHTPYAAHPVWECESVLAPLLNGWLAQIDHRLAPLDLCAPRLS